MTVALTFSPTTVQSACADPAPSLIKCPDQTHVWQKEQCDRGGSGPIGIPGGGQQGRGGLLGLIGRIVGGIL
jgi:hypothetical protein